MATKRAKKPILSHDNNNDDTSIISENTDCDISEVDPVDAAVHHSIDMVQIPEMQKLRSFFSDEKMIKQSGDPETNIIDRRTGRCYKVPDKKIPTMFKILEVCRQQGRALMFNEKQSEPSGIMLDFDIYQDNEADQINDNILYLLCQKIVDLLSKILKIPEVWEVFIGITRKPKIVFNDANDAYKDGLHLIIPGVQISRGLKKYIIDKLIESDTIDRVMASVKPSESKFLNKGNIYQQKHFLDKMSASVPTFFIGSSSKPDTVPYKLTHIYKCTVDKKTQDCITVKDDKFLKGKYNMCHEFSLNYECPGGFIKKMAYEPIEKILPEIATQTKITSQDESKIRNYGDLSLYAVHDIKAAELKDVLDILSPFRYDDYEPWFNVICALANSSPSYKTLAEYFSQKSKKYNPVDFNKFWDNALKGPLRNRKGFTEASIYYWANLDNPDRYLELKKRQVYSILYAKIYEPHTEGHLGNADVADIVYRSLKHKFATDIPKNSNWRVWYEFIVEEDEQIEGEIYKWRITEKEPPISLFRFISERLLSLFDKVLFKAKANVDNSENSTVKYYAKVLANFKASMRKLSDETFIKKVINIAAVRFAQVGFADALNMNPWIRGVSNGILQLSKDHYPKLITGYHSFKVSKYTEVAYEQFNPYDPITKKIIITLRSMFPDDETDTYEFTMYFLASTLDGNTKESIFMLMVAKGANGKTGLVELHKSALGDYGVKMNTSFLTNPKPSADGATPAIMQLKNASFAYYSETNRHEILNAAIMKEMTGQETLTGRKLNANLEQFKPKCHHLVLSNNDFSIISDDHGTWRRIIYNPLRITFIDPAERACDPNNPFERVADPNVTGEWNADPEVRSRYLGYLTWMHYWLYKKYNGKVKQVPHKHIELETNKYRARQNFTAEFLAQRLVKMADPKRQISLASEVEKYRLWHANVHTGVPIPKDMIEQFLSSPLYKHIKKTKLGYYIEGRRFLGDDENLEEGESYDTEELYEVELSEEAKKSFIKETPQEYYDRVCKQYDTYKYLIVGGEPNVDIPTIDAVSGDNLTKNDLAYRKLDDPYLGNNATDFSEIGDYTNYMGVCEDIYTDASEINITSISKSINTNTTINIINDDAVCKATILPNKLNNIKEKKKTGMKSINNMVGSHDDGLVLPDI